MRTHLSGVGMPESSLRMVNEALDEACHKFRRGVPRRAT